MAEKIGEKLQMVFLALHKMAWVELVLPSHLVIQIECMQLLMQKKMVVFTEVMTAEKTGTSLPPMQDFGVEVQILQK